MSSFLYFGYGSNMLGRRLRIGSPSAVRVTAAKLEDHRLDFDRFSARWGGCSATIVPDSGKSVWGAVWEIGNEHSEDLDRQEGVHGGVYVRLQVEVAAVDGSPLRCRAYRLARLPEGSLSCPSALPPERRPSRIYLETILQGASETQVPQEYLQYLKKFPHNGFVGPVDIPHFDVKLSITTENS